MKIGVYIFTDRNDSVFTPAAHAERLVEAGNAAGHEMVIIYEPDLRVGNPMPDVDVIISRPNFIEPAEEHMTFLLRHATAPIVNGSGDIEAAKNKVRQHEVLESVSIPQPTWAIIQSPDETTSAIEQIGFPCVPKVAYGTIGKGIFYAENMETLQPIIDYLFVMEDYPVVVESFIAESNRTDARAFVINGEVVAAYGRKAGASDIRSNTGEGRTRSQIILDDEAKEVATRAAAALGLEIAGVDIIKSNRGWLVLEVNANPGLRSIEEVTGEDIAGAMIAYAVSLVK